MKSIYGQCPFSTTQHALQGKWTIVILFQLSTGTQRFNELQKNIPDITRSMLTRQLRQLEKDLLITRTVYAEVPPRVEYKLSKMGEKFRKVLDQIEEFGLDYIEELKKFKPHVK